MRHPSSDSLRAAVVARAQARKSTSEVEGGSMAPFLRGGERVIWAPVEPRALRRGDLVTFMSGKVLLVHRVLRLRLRHRSLQVREKGDAQRLGRWMDAAHVLGRVETVLRGDRVLDLTRWPWRHVNLLLGMAHGLMDVICELRGKRRKWRGASYSS